MILRTIIQTTILLLAVLILTSMEMTILKIGALFRHWIEQLRN